MPLPDAQPANDRPSPTERVLNAPATPTSAPATAADTPPTRRWMHALHDLLQRAEARISENFRVPPGGG